MLKNKVFWISILLLISIAVTFWTQSRIPALNEKAEVGERINISAIAFDVLFPVNESQPLYERVFKATANWGYTNWKGMTFGFLLAAAFISLLQLLPKTSGSNNRFLNSLFGLGIGSPLGVCVNCATPIAQGMIHAGTRLETSLAMLISSPTLNPIVLTIAFSLLSFHVVLIKVLLTVVFILLIVPVLVRFSGASEKKLSETSEIDDQINRFNLSDNNAELNLQFLQQTWSSAFYCAAVAFLKNLFYIVKLTLPFMVIAGFLGSLLIELLPTGSLSDLKMDPLTLFVISAIGVFLPVPIAFDVLMVNILISSGLDIGLAATLLFSLGIFSIYPALIIGRAVSIRLSVLFIVSVMFVAMAAGWITGSVDREITQRAKATIEKGLQMQVADSVMGDSVKRAVDTCKAFKGSASEQVCLSRVLSSEDLLSAGVDACGAGSFANKGKPAAISVAEMCRQIYAYQKIKKQAVAQQDVSLCKGLKNTMLSDECMVHVIRLRSLVYSSLDACLQIKAPARQRYCRYMIIADRMNMKSPAACELNLSPDMNRQCLDNLHAHIASEDGELNECETLETDNARKICQSTVTSLRITKWQEYSICRLLSGFDEVNTCEDQVLLYRAGREGDVSLCSLLSNRSMINDCRISVVTQKKQTERNNKKLAAFAGTAVFSMAPDSAKKAAAVKPVSRDASSKTGTINWSEVYDDGTVSITYADHFNRDIKAGKVYTVNPGPEFGIETGWQFDLTDFVEPFVYGKGVASGDFNNDGWPDLVFASDNGAHLYLNEKGESFGYAGNISIGSQALNAFVIALVDIDDDGWLDLYLTAYGAGSYIFINDRGQFDPDKFIHLAGKDNILTLAAGFSDWDKDGDLDIVLGNWSYGSEGFFIPEKSQNIWYRNDGLQFKASYPQEPLGETLSILMSDVNGDGYIDLFVGNDRKYPDLFYFGDKEEGFSKVTSDMKVVQTTSFNTMSYESADFNNDLLLDIFSTDMSVAAGVARNYCDSYSTDADKKRCEWLIDSSRSVESLNVGWCDGLENKNRAECYTAMAMSLAKRYKDSALCDKVSDAFSAKSEYCKNLTRKIKAVTLVSDNTDLEQYESNKLLINTADNKFIDATDEMEVADSHWGWTGKAADLDNDGWQDIYIGNGFRFGQRDRDIHSNIFYHNLKGQRFIRDEEDFGLTNYANTPSYTFFDFDLDGDIDIVSSSVLSTPFVYVNQGTTGNSISFVLRDYVGNRFCIGCKIIIHYGDGKKSQIRELKSSGGFMSYDDPVIYFGLAEYEYIDAIEIIWSTGKAWQLDKKLLANRRYKIIRQD